MKQYRVTFSVNGNRHDEVIGAGSASSAEALIKSKYPNATIIGTPREVKQLVYAGITETRVDSLVVNHAEVTDKIYP